jgi:hypothetical protein
MFNKRQSQLIMDNPATMSTLGTQDIGQSKKDNNTENKDEYQGPTNNR